MICCVKRCRNEVYLIFYGFGVCESCWSRYCDGLLDLKEKFKIRDDVVIKGAIVRDVKVFDDWKSYFKGVEKDG